MKDEKKNLELPGRAKNCPFCGARPKMYKMKYYHIVCDSCEDRLVEVWADAIPKAVDKWNERHIDG